ncbi:serine hydrolase [Bifidobacterium scaligerum]|nr:serine hydrolase [Bifidobacterium scaligerum]
MKRQNHVIVIIVMALLVALALGAGCLYVLYAHDSADQNQSPASSAADTRESAERHTQSDQNAAEGSRSDTLDRDVVPSPNATLQKASNRIHAVQSAVDTAVQNNGGTWSVYVEDLATGAIVNVNNQPMAAASEIKLYVMLAVQDGIEQGTLNTNGQDIDMLMNQMITVSSNSATNQLVLMLGDGDMATGMQRVTQTAARYGFRDSRQLRALADTGTDGTGTENWTSAADCGRFLKELYQGKLVSEQASRSMLDLLLGQTRRSKIPAGVPNGIQVANKTGELPGVENDAAIIWGKDAGGGDHDYVMVVMTSGVVSSVAQQQIATLSAQVYESMTS